MPRFARRKPPSVTLSSTDRRSHLRVAGKHWELTKLALTGRYTVMRGGTRIDACAILPMLRAARSEKGSLDQSHQSDRSAQ